MGSFSTTTWPEHVSKQLIKKLVRGKESAAKLQTLLLRNPSGENGPISAEQLSGEILASLTDSISFVVKSFSDTNNNNNTSNCNKTGSVHGHQLSETVTVNGGQGQDVISQINPHEPLDHHSHCDDRSSGDSGEISRKRPPFKDRRGCYKRRKSSQSWSTVTSTIEDGQAWRKYGQKAILNSEYPRAYFRCTKRHDQGCKATKQVQQTQCNPNLYQTTYIGHHSCKHILKSPQMIVDSQHFDDNNNNIIINFNKPQQVKLEETQIIEDQYTSDDKSSFDTDLWSDLKDFELSRADKSIIGQSENDDQGVENSIKFSFFDQTNDSSLITLDDMVESIEFRDIDDFHFDDSNFPIGSA